MPPPGIGMAASFSGLSATTVSVVSSRPATEADTVDDGAVRAVMEQAMDRYARGPDPEMLTASIEAVKNALPVAQRKTALNDLVQIANVDGVFLDSEEDLLNDLVAAWSLDAFTDYGEEEGSNG